MMDRDIAVIIPALEKNRYSKEGDLVRFGDLSLLEWKLIQVKNFTQAENVFVTTPSSKIERIAKSYGMNAIRRKDNLSMHETIVRSVKQIDKEILIWTHATSPFVSSNDFRVMLNKYLKRRSKSDSLVAVYKLHEFAIFKNRALNFELTKLRGRKSIVPVNIITNGCFIARKEVYLKYKNLFGIKPYLYGVDKLTSMEIKEAKDLSIANDLISLFFKKELLD